MSIKIHAYKNGSESAKALRDALGIKMLLPGGKGKWKGKAGDTLINWGSASPHKNQGKANYTNKPDTVAIAHNKLKTKRALDKANNPYIIPFTTDKAVASKWIVNGDIAVARTLLTANSGRGITIAERVEELVDAPLYTKYVKKTDEYRIHVFGGKIIDVQRKARKKEVEDDKVNWKVRNLDGGFIFARNDIVAPESVCIAALTAVRDLGLLHGAVDVGYHNKHGTYVYEVNTACGLAGSTLVTYAKAFADYLDIPAKNLNIDEAEYIPMAKQPITTLADAEREQEEVEELVQIDDVVVEVEDKPVDEDRVEVCYIRMFGTRDGFNKVKAIKELLRVTGFGLKEAKQIFDAVDVGKVRTIQVRKTKVELMRITALFRGASIHCRIVNEGREIENLLDVNGNLTDKQQPLNWGDQVAIGGNMIAGNIAINEVAGNAIREEFAIDIERGNLKLKVPEDKLIEFLLKVEGLNV